MVDDLSITVPILKMPCNDIFITMTNNQRGFCLLFDMQKVHIKYGINIFQDIFRYMFITTPLMILFHTVLLSMLPLWSQLIKQK